MNTDLETIENYLTGQLSPDERLRFEEALRTDPAVADALAFYMLTKQVAQNEARELRRAELDALRKKTSSETEETTQSEPRTRPLWGFPIRWIAAASIVLLLGLGWYFFNPAGSTLDARQLADTYVTEHFMQLPTTMDGGTSGDPAVDSLKMGVGLFNKGQLTEADVVFQELLAHRPDMDNALNYAGIVSLRQGNYDKAIELFHRLGQQKDLFANPGTFYEALAYLKRGQPLDKVQAKKLFEEVITRNLEGKQEAEKFIATISQ